MSSGAFSEAQNQIPALQEQGVYIFNECFSSQEQR